MASLPRQDNAIETAAPRPYLALPANTLRHHRQIPAIGLYAADTRHYRYFISPIDFKYRNYQIYYKILIDFAACQQEMAAEHFALFELS